MLFTQTRLASRRAAGSLKYIPSSFFKHSIRLASRRAAEPQIIHLPRSLNTQCDWRAASDKRLQQMTLYSVVPSQIPPSPGMAEKLFKCPHPRGNYQVTVLTIMLLKLCM